MGGDAARQTAPESAHPRQDPSQGRHGAAWLVARRAPRAAAWRARPLRKCADRRRSGQLRPRVRWQPAQGHALPGLASGGAGMTLQAFIDWFVVALRWIHIVAILGWVGTSLYFMWLDSKLRPAQPADDSVMGEAWMGHGGGFYIMQKRRIAAGQVPSPVYWFRNEAAITWITGFLLLVFIYYWTGGVDLVDPETSVISPGAAIGFAIVLLVAAWIVYDQLWA